VLESETRHGRIDVSNATIGSKQVLLASIGGTVAYDHPGGPGPEPPSVITSDLATGVCRAAVPREGHPGGGLGNFFSGCLARLGPIEFPYGANMGAASFVGAQGDITIHKFLSQSADSSCDFSAWSGNITVDGAADVSFCTFATGTDAEGGSVTFGGS
jgi:hypothetical protein